MRQQLRLRVLVPVAVLGLLGAGVGAFAMGQPANPASTPLPASSAAVDTGATDVGQTETGAATTTPEAPAPPPAPPKPKPEKTPLEQELAAHRAVVVVFQTPGADLDAAAVREARAGAAAVSAGFLAVNVTEEGAVADIAAEYEVLEAPTVLVIVRRGEVRAGFDGYTDRQTVAQAVTNALK
jgi:hypothetical protein